MGGVRAGLIEQEVAETTEFGFQLRRYLKGNQMHGLFSKASGMTHDVIGAAIEVHKDEGTGLLESIDEWCLTKQLALRDYAIASQQQVTVQFKRLSCSVT